MIADNWAKCPNCIKIDRDQKIKMRQKIDDSYGKIDQAEYLKLVEAANHEQQFRETLREDFQIGIDPFGMFSVTFAARCDRCGFKFDFTNSKDSFENKG